MNTPETTETRWVKSTSHRSRERLLSTCRMAGYAEPESWFRKARGRGRTEDEYFAVPVDVDVSRIKGITVLARGLRPDELIRPLRGL